MFDSKTFNMENFNMNQFKKMLYVFLTIRPWITQYYSGCATFDWTILIRFKSYNITGTILLTSQQPRENSLISLIARKKMHTYRQYLTAAVSSKKYNIALSLCLKYKFRYDKKKSINMSSQFFSGRTPTTYII